MIDLHFHCLPGIDDGPRDWNEAVALCRAAYAEGTETIVATPHVLRDSWLNDDPVVRDQLLVKLNDMLGGKPTILAGCEYFFSADAIDLWQMGRQELPADADFAIGDWGTEHAFSQSQSGIPAASSISNQQSQISEALPISNQQSQISSALTGLNRTNYLLVEFPSTRLPEQAVATFHEFSVIGVTPVIAHPERNMALAENPDKLARLVDLGAIVQITAGSLLGFFGKRAEAACEDFFTRGLIHVVASDAHSTKHRPPQLAAARKRVSQTWGLEAETAFFDTNARAIISGKHL